MIYFQILAKLGAPPLAQLALFKEAQRVLSPGNILQNLSFSALQHILLPLLLCIFL